MERPEGEVLAGADRAVWVFALYWRHAGPVPHRHPASGVDHNRLVRPCRKLFFVCAFFKPADEVFEWRHQTSATYQTPTYAMHLPDCVRVSVAHPARAIGRHLSVAVGDDGHLGLTATVG